MNRELRPKPGTVLDDQKGFRKTVVVRCVETEDKLTIHTLTTFNKKHNWQGECPRDSKGTITHTKMMCVNGPCEGQKHVPDDVEGRGYLVFNNANRYIRTRRAIRKNGEPPPKTVLVWFP